jgi:hypothetical protein
VVGRFVLAIVGLVGLAGCASAAPKPISLAVSPGEAAVEGEFQRRLVLEQQFINEHRLDTIRYRLATAAAPFCRGDARREFGLRVANSWSFTGGDRAVARVGFGFDDRLRVQHLVPDSPARKSGLHSGDAILEANGRAIGADSGATTLFSSEADRGPLALAVERPGARGEAPRRFTVRIDAVEACRFDIQLLNQEAVSATVTGRGIAVTKGMMWFANDAQLAFVIAHELAHVVGDHARLVQRGAMRQVEVEAAADYLGLYVMARAGYDIAEAPQFWRRIAANFPHMMAQAATHPGTSYRYVALTKAVEEIRVKLASGAPLMPGTAPELARAGGN